MSLLFFGITYRYAVREDTNQQLKQGVVLSFAFLRALSLINPPDNCTSLPLNCGPPLYYVSLSMVLSGLSFFIESILAYGGAALSIENLFELGFIRKCDRLED